MLKAWFVLGFLAISSVSMADPVADARYARVMNEPVIASAIRAVQAKYLVLCKAPQETDLNWMCSANGPACGFMFQTTCAFTNGAAGGMLIAIQGLDTGVAAELEFFRLTPIQP